MRKTGLSSLWSGSVARGGKVTFLPRNVLLANQTPPIAETKSPRRISQPRKKGIDIYYQCKPFA
jgi:hypothetical protein